MSRTYGERYDNVSFTNAYREAYREFRFRRYTDRGNEIPRIPYATIISIKDVRSLHGRGMQTNHVERSSLSLSPLSRPFRVWYLRACASSPVDKKRWSRAGFAVRFDSPVNFRRYREYTIYLTSRDYQRLIDLDFYDKPSYKNLRVKIRVTCTIMCTQIFSNNSRCT